MYSSYYAMLTGSDNYYYVYTTEVLRCGNEH